MTPSPHQAEAEKVAEDLVSTYVPILKTSELTTDITIREHLTPAITQALLSFANRVAEEAVIADRKIWDAQYEADLRIRENEGYAKGVEDAAKLMEVDKLWIRASQIRALIKPEEALEKMAWGKLEEEAYAKGVEDAARIASGDSHKHFHGEDCHKYISQKIRALIQPGEGS